MRFLRSLLLTLLLILSTQVGFSQQFLADSLSLELAKTSDPLQKVDYLTGLSRALAFAGKIDDAITKADDAISLAQSNDYPEGAGVAMTFKGAVIGAAKGKMKEEFELYKQADKIAHATGSKNLYAFVQYHLAEHYSIDKEDRKKGLSILLNALENINEQNASGKHLGNIHKNLAIIYHELNDQEANLKHLKEALYYFDYAVKHPFIIPKLGRQSAMEMDGGLMNKGQILMYLSDAYRKMGDFEKALANIQESIAIYKVTNADFFVAVTLTRKAIIFESMGQLDKAIASYQGAVLKWTELKRVYPAADSYKNLGDVFLKLKEYKSAADNYNKGKKIYEELQDSAKLIKIYLVLGQLDFQQKKIDEALAYYNQALDINLASQDSLSLPKVLNNIGRVWREKKAFKKALAYHYDALAITKKTSGNLLSTYSALSETHFQQNNLDSAIYYGTQQLAIAKERGSLNNRRNVNKRLSKIYEKSGRFEEALNFQKNYNALNDSLFTVDAASKLKEEQVRQNVETYKEREAMANTQAALLTTRNQLYLALAAALLGLLLIGGYLFQQLKKTKQKVDLQNTQLQQLNATKDKFFGIIAHDIRSPIVALDSVGEQMDFYLEKQRMGKLKSLGKEVDQTAKRLSALLDNLLNWALLQQGVIPYHPQSINVKQVTANIMDMFQANASIKNLTLHTEIDSTLAAFADQSALSAILRNLISNAIKFTPKGGTVSVSTQLKADKVFITINDTGTGIPAEKLKTLFTLNKKSEQGTAGEAGTGLGLILCKELSELNKGTIQVKSELNTGSQFTLTLPLAA